MSELGASNLYAYLANHPSGETDFLGLLPVAPVLVFLRDCLWDYLKTSATRPLKRVVDGTQACAFLRERLKDSLLDFSCGYDFCAGVPLKADFKPLTDDPTIAQQLARCFLGKLESGVAGKVNKKLFDTLTDKEKEMVEDALSKASGAVQDATVKDVKVVVVGKCQGKKLGYQIQLGTTIEIGNSSFEFGGGTIPSGICGAVFSDLHKHCEDCTQ